MYFFCCCPIKFRGLRKCTRCCWIVTCAARFVFKMQLRLSRYCGCNGVVGLQLRGMLTNKGAEMGAEPCRLPRVGSFSIGMLLKDLARKGSKTYDVKG